MKSIQFVFGLHNHQPVGNFDSVFEDAFNAAYLPFLERLERHAGMRVALHHTGPLLDWIEKHRRGYLDRLGRLVARGQVELLGGAFYEPILPVIPEEDRVGQIVKMSDWLQRVFGVRPRGMRLAERVWEPTLPSTMRRAGIEFTVLDDSHFKSVGIAGDGTLGYWLTEDQGESVAVFPINERSRYTIPYAEPEATMRELHELATEESTRTVIFADDGEKFGVWPDSYRHCYKAGWVDAFFTLVEKNSEWLSMKTFSEVLDETGPMGRVYLPTASYIEMMEWAMPPQAIRNYQGFVEALKKGQSWEQNKIFVRGGFWRSFFSKYDESNHMHKKMLRASRKLRELPAAAQKKAEFAEAREHLWQGQCNCAYWHGVFGGLYLTNLRTALYRHLIAADRMADDLAHDGKAYCEIEAKDFDVDGEAELLVETPTQALVVKPSLGGMLVEHDVREKDFNLLDTLTRRPESYHADLLHHSPETRVKEENLGRLLSFDWYRRGSLIDHFLDIDATPSNFRTARYPEMGNLVVAPYAAAWKKSKGGLKILMRGEGMVETAMPREGALPVVVEKALEVRGDKLGYTASYSVTNLGESPLQTRFGVEFNVNLLAGHAPDRYHRIEGVDLGDADRMDSMGSVDGAARFRVVDEWMGIEVEWELSHPAQHWRLPIETASRSEAGVERVYQSTVVMPVWSLNLKPGETAELKIVQRVKIRK